MSYKKFIEYLPKGEKVTREEYEDRIKELEGLEISLPENLLSSFDHKFAQVIKLTELVKEHDAERLAKAIQRRSYNQEWISQGQTEPGPLATREDWFRYKHDCQKAGINITHSYIAKKLNITVGHVRNLYSTWMAGEEF